MKTMIRLLAVGATVAVLALPSAAKALVAQPETLQDQCTPENKDAWYATFRETFKTDQQPKAYDAAKKYLTACASEDTDITKYLKRWVGAYEKEIRKVRLPQLLYNDKKYPDAYKLGTEILADEPENLKVLIDLGANGYLIAPLKNPGLNAESLTYARKAIQLLDSGKAIDNWQPFSGKDEALAYLNYTIGALTLEQDPASALTSLIKAVQFETQLKKSPLPYAYIGGAYESGPYAKQSAEYKEKYQGKDETPESKLALANINQIVDRMIDAYARAVAAAGTDARYQSGKAAWTEILKTWYKYRHNQSDEGMNELVATVLSRPLPPEPTPLTTLPATPAATPAGSSGTGSGGSGVTVGGPTSVSNKPTTPVTAAAPNKATGARTSGANPNRPRRNH
jgi:hypothetical protein